MGLRQLLTRPTLSRCVATGIVAGHRKCGVALLLGGCSAGREVSRGLLPASFGSSPSAVAPKCDERRLLARNPADATGGQKWLGKPMCTISSDGD